MSGRDINDILQSSWSGLDPEPDPGWQSAKLLADELFECCRSDGLSEECIREIIERHELTPHHDNRVSSYEFFRMACCNANATEAIIQYLLKYFPDALSTVIEGLLPLHYACYNIIDVSFGVIQLLIDAAPDSVHRKDDGGNMPLHHLCNNKDLEEKDLEEIKSLEILKLLLERCPESIRHANDGGYLPIHLAAMTTKSPEFFSVLIEAYPGSERMADDKGVLPLHCACRHGTVDAVKYLYNLYPDAIEHAPSGTLYPIHFAIADANVDVVKFLLGCDPNVKFQK